MEVTGKITAIPPAKTGVSARGPWRKAFIVVEYDGGQFPKQILLSNMKNAEDFSRLRVGDRGTFKFDCSVSERNGNYYLDTNCWSWKIEDVESAPAPRGGEPF